VKILDFLFNHITIFLYYRIIYENSYRNAGEPINNNFSPVEVILAKAPRRVPQAVALIFQNVCGG
jgi:hypothetical protein